MQCVHCREDASPVALAPANIWCQNCGTLMIGDDDGQMKYWHIPHLAKEWRVPAWMYILNLGVALALGYVIRGGH